VQEDRKYEGYWWRPADPGTKVPGILSFSQDEIRLELWGAFEAPKPGPVGDMEDEPRLLGMTTSGNPLALERNLGLGTTFNTRGASVTKYGPHTVLVGAWYEPDEEVRFDAVQIRFSDLDMWAATSGFTQSFTVDEKRNSMDRIDVAFVPPEPVEVALDDTTSLSITWSFTWSGLKHVTTAVSLEQTALFKVSFAKGATLNACLQYVFHLRNFLSLGVGRPIQILGRVEGEATPRRTDHRYACTRTCSTPGTRQPKRGTRWRPGSERCSDEPE
jgi:ApeA N-terminal domain 1